MYIYMYVCMCVRACVCVCVCVCLQFFDNALAYESVVRQSESKRDRQVETSAFVHTPNIWHVYISVSLYVCVCVFVCV